MPKSRAEDWARHTRPGRESRQRSRDDSTAARSLTKRSPAARSPARSPAQPSRSASPDSHARHHHRHRRRSRHARPSGAEPEPEPAELPYSVRPLVKSDFAAFEPLFAFYLELQKQRYLEDMDEREARGRWKRFVGKWNRNELAEGWYDPEVFCRCAEEYAGREGGASPLASDEDEDEDEDEDGPGGSGSDDGSDDEDDHGGGDDYGPRLPARDPARRVGVKQPTRRDLAARDELLQEQREADGEAARQARRAERRLQKERLDELVPAAQPGTRERRLEKKKEAGESMRQFRERSPGVEVGDGELMGGGDTAEEYRRMKQREHRRKSDRQVRREEFERAKGEEMELRRRAWQRREEGTVSMLRELAKQRFGQGP
ncbi:uncharacterized protein UV8b_00522 [Ustilaginoidea virens]|uniref:Uncharacterized protein n=1 Tax=Ustilaginoidea virens TaxID=1159556 RepID=A0A8E5MEE9_USTVR|nr:uncharacterized protein UV8b_00522 [Ustilaginoidea virens]QUC16281.1 hypothetical protein UV8b_00522 [Ustilaginoidea virens]